MSLVQTHLAAVEPASVVYAWLVSLARTSILNTLHDSFTNGALHLEFDGSVHRYGSAKDPHPVHLSVLNDRFWLRVFLSGGLGFSEAYMSGEIAISDLTRIIELFIDNLSSVARVSSLYARAAAALSSVSNAFLGQTRFMARLNAIASYDQSNELFKAFLSTEMMYSTALWADAEGGVAGDLRRDAEKLVHYDDDDKPRRDSWDDGLEAAQRRKIHHVLRAARVRPGHRLLEFGSGWGGLAIEAARTYGCTVDTLTLSVEQKTLAEARIAAAGVADRVRVHLMDYRDLPPEWERAFDAFVSVEMLEHVGSKHYVTYFKLVDFALKPRGATAVVTSSTFPESRYSEYQAEDFMRRYMWPNSCLPSATVLVNAACQASRGTLRLQGVEDHSAHYPRTLRTWDRRLKARLSQDAMARTHPALRDADEFAVFLRKWEYLFAYAGAGFAKGYITCHMLTFCREGGVQ